ESNHSCALHTPETSPSGRLEGAGPGGSAVYARWRPANTGLTERTVYQDILAHLPIGALRCYGFVHAGGQGSETRGQGSAGPDLTPDPSPLTPGAGGLLIEASVSQLNLLEARWSQVESFCDRMPGTLVHGDFVGKNMNIRTSTDGLALMVFDWETAGWGTPAADVAKVDLDAYWAVVRE